MIHLKKFNESKHINIISNYDYSPIYNTTEEYSELDKQQFSKEIKILEDKKNRLKNIFENNQEFINTLNEVNELSVQINNLKNSFNPTVYLSVSKDNRTGVSNIIAKTNWVDRNGKKNISVYVGLLNKFKLGVKDPEAIEIAKRKMKELLFKKYI